jgi:hypothetical protein
MREIFFGIAAMVMVMFPVSGSGDLLSNMNNRQEAENVMSDYFNLLATGSTSGVLELLTGPMLKSKENLLRNNPSYSNFYMTRYKNVHFVYSNYNIIDASKSTIDVLIRQNPEEEISSRFTLAIEKERLKIYAEEEIVIPGSRNRTRK